MNNLDKFREDTRDWLDKNCPPSMRNGADPKTPIDEVWGGRNAKYKNPESKIWLERMGEKGWTMPTVPKEYGGGGLTKEKVKILNEEMFFIGAKQPLLSFGIWMLAPVLLEYGSEEQKKEHIPKIIKGEIRWCQGYSEPGSGSDLASLKTKAVLDGDNYIVNGSKTWTTLAQNADWIFCLVRTDNSGIKQEGISFLLIDMNTPGIEVKPIITIDGEHEVNSVFFTDVKVPAKNLIGEEGKGWTYAKFLLAHERFGIAGVGASMRSLNRLKDIVAKLNNEDLQRKVNQLEVDLSAIEITELRLLSALENGGHPGAESSILKIKGTEMQQALSELFVEASGEYALMYPGPHGYENNEKPAGPDYAAEGLSAFLNMRKTSIYGGSNEIQKNILSKFVLGV